MKFFRLLLRLFPSDFRQEFEEEMAFVFEQERAGVRHGTGMGGLMSFWRRVVFGVVKTAPKQHLANLGQDIRYALRLARARPSFTAAAALSMAIGIGATTTVFSVFKGTFLYSIPGIGAPDRLVNVKVKTVFDETFRRTSYLNYLDLREDEVLEALAGFHGTSLSLSQPGEPAEVVASQFVTSNYFDTLAVTPSLGRFFGEEEGRSVNAHPVVVVSDWLWTNRFGRSSDILGHELWLNGRAFSVIGVAPEGFRGHFVGFNFDVFVLEAMGQIADLPDRTNRQGHWIELVGRLKPELNLSQAQASLDVTAEQMAQSNPRVNQGFEVAIESNDGFDADIRTGLFVFLTALMGISIVVLATGCANVTNMMLSRLVSRRKELALRLALGAARSRLRGQLFTEAAVLMFVGAAGGVVVAYWGIEWMERALPAFGGRITLDFRLEATTVMWAMLVAVLSTLVVGFTPALQWSRGNYFLALRQSDQDRQLSWLRRTLVVGQIAMALIVLICAGLFLRALHHASTIDLGFEASDVQLASVSPSLARMSEAQSREFFDDLLNQLESQPGVAALGIADRVPLGLGARFFPNPVTLRITGHLPPADKEGFAIEHGSVSPGYFGTMRIPVVEGRLFTNFDRLDSRPVAIVNESFVARFWPSDSAVGRLVRRVSPEMSDSEPIQIVGVVRDSKYRTADEPSTPYVYLPFDQNFPARASILLRSEAGAAPDPISEALRAKVLELAPNLPIREFTSLDEHIGVSLLPQRVGGGIAAGMSLVSLLLASLGLYGVVAHSVSRRSREIGLRMSLGAESRSVVALIVKHGMVMALMGIGVGVPIAMLGTRLLRSFLVGLSSMDALTYTSASLFLAVIALGASYFPARRAARIDPNVVLRAE